MDQVYGIIELADKWCAKVNSVYNETEAYSWGRGIEGTNEVKVFSGGPEQTIYEFLNSFDNYCIGPKAIKAD